MSLTMGAHWHLQETQFHASTKHIECIVIMTSGDSQKERSAWVMQNSVTNIFTKALCSEKSKAFCKPLGFRPLRNIDPPKSIIHPTSLVFMPHLHIITPRGDLLPSKV